MKEVEKPDCKKLNSIDLSQKIGHIKITFHIAESYQVPAN